MTDVILSPLGAEGTITNDALSATGLTVEVRTPEGWRPIVRDLSLTLRRGEIAALVGETGSGKTMTALSLIGLLPSTARRLRGQISLSGQDLTSLDEKAMTRIRGRRISMIFQDPLAALNPVRRVGYQISEPMVVHQRISRRAALKRAAKLLETMGFENAAHSLRLYPHELSGGMRQRVLIALALSCGPDVLLADEPTTALDVTVQVQILDLIRSLVDERGLSVLLVTHNLGVASLVADRIHVMYGGRIVESGPVEEVLRFPNHPYTRALVGCVPRVDTLVRPLPTLPGSVQGVWDIHNGCRFAPRCVHAIEHCVEVDPPLELLDSAAHASACWVFGAHG